MTQDIKCKKKVLVIEDEPTICRVCARILSAGNYSVDTAGNGLEARKLIQNKEYDICLSDVRMPEMNGMELYRFLLNSYPRLAGKIIFMTGDCLSADTRAFMEGTGAKYILKPFSPDELNAAVGELV